MSIDMTPSDYRNRLSNGDIVYVIDDQEVDKPLVKQGTVIQLNDWRRYPLILLWPSIFKNPGNSGVAVAKSPREIFTHAEVWSAIYDSNAYEYLERPNYEDIEVTLEDPNCNRGILVPILGGLIISRLADDWLRNPKDVEY